MRNETKVVRKIVAALVVGILIVNIGASDVVLWFKIAVIALLSVAGIRIFAKDDSIDDDHIIMD